MNILPPDRRRDLICASRDTGSFKCSSSSIRIMASKLSMGACSRESKTVNPCERRNRDEASSASMQLIWADGTSCFKERSMWPDPEPKSQYSGVGFDEAGPKPKLNQPRVPCCELLQHFIGIRQQHDALRGRGVLGINMPTARTLQGGDVSRRECLSRCSRANRAIHSTPDQVDRSHCEVPTCASAPRQFLCFQGSTRPEPFRCDMGYGADRRP